MLSVMLMRGRRTCPQEKKKGGGRAVPSIALRDKEKEYRKKSAQSISPANYAREEGGAFVFLIIQR